MQKFMLSKKNHIALVSAVLIAVGFAGSLGFKNEVVALWALAAASVLGVAHIAIQAYQALRVRVVSIDVLVTIAVIGAFLIRNFEESAIVTFLFLFGAFLEQRTLNKTRSAIKELTEMAPESALKRMPDGEFQEVAVDGVAVGDILLVKTGAKIPVDGSVLSGEGSINEASITGESLPVAKAAGDHVYAGTILDNGTVQIVADRIGEDTTFGRIIELVEEAQDSKSGAERFIDRFARYYTPAVLLLGILVWVFSRNLELAITILVLGCPGALVIGVAASIQVILQDAQIIDTIVNSLSTLVGDMPIALAAVASSVIQGIINLFIPGGSGQALVTMPILIPLADLIGMSRQLMITSFQVGDGLTNLIVPTSGGTLAMLALGKVSYAQWLRVITPLLVLIYGMCWIALVVGHYLGY